jgi:TonB family protein
MRSTGLLTLWLLAACASSPSDRSATPLGRADTTPVLVDARGMASDARSLLDSVPKLLSCPPVHYPETLRLARVQGRVVLQFVLDTLGRAEPSSIEAVETPHDSMTHSAREALVSCRFTAGRVRGRGVRVLLRVPWDFALRAPADTTAHKHEHSR